MSASRLRLFALLAASAAGLAACADDYGYGYASAGYGAPGYSCDPNYYDCGAYGGYGYDAYDYGYGDPWYGWYGDYFYPGTGFFVFDRFGHRFRMDRDQHRHWAGRRGNRSWTDQRFQHWNGFHGQSGHRSMAPRMGAHMSAPMGRRPGR